MAIMQGLVSTPKFKTLSEIEIFRVSAFGTCLAQRSVQIVTSNDTGDVLVGPN